MLLLKELLDIKQNQSLEQLLEDMGNLKKLGLGPLVNAFKQTFYKSTNRGGALHDTEVGNKFSRGNGIGRDSEIIDYSGVIKKWAHVRKAFTSHPDSVAIAFRLNDKPIALMVAQSEDVTRASAACGLAWDLTKSGLTEAEQNKALAALDQPKGGTKGKSTHDKVEEIFTSSWEKKRELEKDGKTLGGTKTIPYDDYEDWSDRVRGGGAKLDKSGDKIIAKVGDTEVGSWNKDTKKGELIVTKSEAESINSMISTVYGKPKQYVGITHTIKQAASFIEELAMFGSLTAQVVLADKNAMAKRGERIANKPIDPKELKLFKDDVSVRLAKYKNSKIESVADCKQFLEKVLTGGFKKLTLGKRTYTTQPGDYYNDAIITKLITGKPLQISFDADRSTNDYTNMVITVKLVNGVLTPIEARYSGDDHKQVTEKF